MGMFSKSWWFHSSVRKERAQREAERQEAQRREWEPKKIQIPHILDDLERSERAAENLRQRGINPPVDPHPKDRMQCAPDPKGILDALNEGMDLGELTTERLDWTRAAQTTNMDQVNDTLFHTIYKVGEKFVKDSMNIQDCMDKQDEKYKLELAQYHNYLKEEKKKIPESEMVEKTVTSNDPGHPKYQPPAKPAPQQDSFGFNFYTNGNTTGGRITWRF